MTNLVALPVGTVLVDDYRIERVLGAGGFGITYLAEELPLARRVTIKEYFPVDFAARDAADDVAPRSLDCEGDYGWGLDRFLAEAQTVARFNHPNIVRVYRYFRARNTGYMVLHFEEGQSLKSWLKGLGRAPRQAELDRIVTPLLDALTVVHAADYLHRDIAPDNVMIRRDNAPVLIDFGSARSDVARHSKTVSALVKPGYSPYEQYATSGRQQGPWTDIYSLGATLYQAVSGKRPPDAPSRMGIDEIVPVAEAALSSYRPGFLQAIDKALRLDITERPQSVAEWRAMLEAPQAKPASKVTLGAVGDNQGPRSGHPSAASRKDDGIGDAGVSNAAATSTGAKSSEAKIRPQSPPLATGVRRRSRSTGVLAAFVEGWRGAVPPVTSVRAKPATMPSPVRPVARAQAEPVQPPPAEIAPKTPPAPQVAEAAPSPQPTPSSARSRSAAASGGPPDAVVKGGRRGGWLQRRVPWASLAGFRADREDRAPPRPIGPKRPVRWKGLAAKLGLGIAVAGAAAIYQERNPTERREGVGTISSERAIVVPVGQLKGHRGPIQGVAFAGDGRFIVTTGDDSTLKVWSAASGDLVRSIDMRQGAATSIAIHGMRAAAGHKNGHATVWSVGTGSILATLRRGDSAITALAFLNAGERIATTAADATVAVWRLAAGDAPEHLLAGHEGPVHAIAYASRGQALATAGADRHIRLWSVEAGGGALTRTYRGHVAAATALAISGDGRTLASASRDGNIRLWSLHGHRLHRTLTGHVGAVVGLSFAPDSQTLASAGEDGSVRVWETRRGRQVRSFNSHTGSLTGVAFAPDGKRVAAAGSDGKVRIWDATTPGPDS